MTHKKRLKELTLKNNFMFGAVMIEEENCKGFLEMVLGFSIEHIEVSKEKSIVYHPEYKGIRLDVYAKDENNTRYNVEMQVMQNTNLARRTRYYQSQIDMELLLSGKDYTELPYTYVIFICDFDPFGKKKYRYTFENRCKEDQDLFLGDGCERIFLSTYGENETEVPKALVKFLKFVKADLKESETDFGDDYVERLQKAIRHIKESREMEERFMLFEELLRDERKEGKAEARAEDILELLEELGTVPEELHIKIKSEKDLEVLKKWHKQAARAGSLNEFTKNFQ